MHKVQEIEIHSDHIENVTTGAALYARYLLADNHSAEEDAWMAWAWSPDMTDNVRNMAREFGRVLFHSIEK